MDHAKGTTTSVGKVLRYILSRSYKNYNNTQLMKCRFNRIVLNIFQEGFTFMVLFHVSTHCLRSGFIRLTYYGCEAR